MARLLWWGYIQEYTSLHGWYRGTWQCCFAVFKDMATRTCCGQQRTKVTWQAPSRRPLYLRDEAEGRLPPVPLCSMEPSCTCRTSLRVYHPHPREAGTRVGNSFHKAEYGWGQGRSHAFTRGKNKLENKQSVC